MGDELGVMVVVMASVTGNIISVWELPFPSPSVIDGPLFAGSVVALVDDSAKKLDIIYN
jgi:hypothetical protein